MDKNKALKFLISGDPEQIEAAIGYVYDKLETEVQEGRFEELRDSQKVVFVAMSFIGLVGNGGFMHFLLSEDYGEHFLLVADSLRAVGLDEYAIVADQAFSNLSHDATDEELDGLEEIEDGYWKLYYKNESGDLDRINAKIGAFIVNNGDLLN